MQAPKFKIVPINQQTYAAWCQIAEAQDYPDPLPPKEAIILVTEENGVSTLVSAVGVHTTDGPYMLAEDAVMNPHVPLSLRADAAKFTIEALIALANTKGKTLVGNVKVKSLAKMMAQMGFVQEKGNYCMVLEPGGQSVSPSQTTFVHKREEPQASIPTPKGSPQGVTTTDATIGESKREDSIPIPDDDARPEADPAEDRGNPPSPKPRPRAKRQRANRSKRGNPDGDGDSQGSSGGPA